MFDIKAFMQAHGIAKDEVWQVHGRTWVVKHYALERVAATKGIRFFKPEIIEKDSASLLTAAQYLTRHKESFLGQLHEREKILKAQFEAIDSLDYRPSFEYSRTLSEDFLESIG